MWSQRRVVVPSLTFLLLLGLTSVTGAVDGVVLIDQNRALAGNVTPGDLPGFPVTISRPGGYRLSGNLDVADPDATAIEIIANHVTLDLNGFMIQGPMDACSFMIQPVWCQVNHVGVGILGGPASFLGQLHSGTTVLNGTIRAMASDGVRVGRLARIENLTAADNRGIGIIADVASIVSANRAYLNGDTGIWASRSVVTGNTVWGNDGHGIVGLSTIVANNVLIDNHNGQNLQVVPVIPSGANLCGTIPC